MKHVAQYANFAQPWQIVKCGYVIYCFLNYIGFQRVPFKKNLDRGILYYSSKSLKNNQPVLKTTIVGPTLALLLLLFFVPTRRAIKVTPGSTFFNVLAKGTRGCVNMKQITTDGHSSNLVLYSFVLQLLKPVVNITKHSFPNDFMSRRFAKMQVQTVRVGVGGE